MQRRSSSYAVYVSGRAGMEEMRMKEKLESLFDFRMIKKEEADKAVSLEHACFPPNEQLPDEAVRERVENIPEMVLIANHKELNELAGMINSTLTNDDAFNDSFFTDLSTHDPNGMNVMITGLEVHPKYQGKGLGTYLMKRYLTMMKEQGRKRAVLTCTEDKIRMYEKMGFRDSGISKSTYGNEIWHEMEYLLENEG